MIRGHWSGSLVKYHLSGVTDQPRVSGQRSGSLVSVTGQVRGHGSSVMIRVKVSQGSLVRVKGQMIFRGQGSWVKNLWSRVMIRGQRTGSLVSGQGSVQVSLVRVKGHWSEVTDRVKDQGSVVEGHDQGSLNRVASLVKCHWSNDFLSSDLIRMHELLK